MDLPTHLSPQNRRQQSHHTEFSVAAASSTTASPASRRRRTTSALPDCCRTCRLRKVKCSGNPGHGPCINCSRLDLSCNFAVADGGQDATDKVSRTTPSHSHTEAGTLRKRAQRACAECHSHKTKCSGDLPRCKRCDANGLACEYTPAKRKFASVTTTDTGSSQTPQPSQHSQPSQSSRPSRNPSTARNDDHFFLRQSSMPSTSASDKTGGTDSPSTSVDANGKAVESTAGGAAGADGGTASFVLQIDTSTLTAEQLLSRKDLILRHMDAYFENLYWVPCLGIFHPDTTYAQIQEGTFHPAHAAAVCAISSFFVNPTETGREFGRKCADQVEFHLFRNCYRFDEDTLCAFALSGAYNFLSGSFAKVWQCSGMATRLMLGLQINWEAATKNRTFIEQETIRRIAWQIYNMDRLLAGGYDEYISCRSDVMKIRLPCNDRAFRENMPLVVEKLYDTPSKCRNALGMHGHQLRLVDLTHRIQATTKKLMSPALASRSNREPSKVMAEFNSLQNELTRIGASLPDDLRLSDQSIYRYVAAQERPGFVYLHNHIFAAHIELYRFALPGVGDKGAIDLSKKLPREFLAKCQKQAVAHALCLARFCDMVLRVFGALPKSGKLQFAGDVTIASIATKALKVLLIALKYGLYRDLAENSSAPLWRNEPADENHIRGLITSLLRITEPWSHILQISAQAHEANLAMVIEFDRTRQFTDRGESSRLAKRKATSGAQLPPPHYILDRAHAGAVEDEKRSRASHSAAQKRWFDTPQSPTAAEPTPYDVPDVEYDGEDGPPGLPIFLAQARGGVPPQMPGQFDGDLMMDMAAPKPWTIPELNVMLTGNPHLLGDDGLPLLHLDGPPDPTMFENAPPFAPPLMHQQVGMFLGYPQNYGPPPTAPPEPQYMQQASFG